MEKIFFTERPTLEELIKKHGTIECNIRKEYEKQYNDIQYEIEKDKDLQIQAIRNSDKVYVK